MKEETVGLSYNLENQSFIEQMYKGWVLIFSIAVLVPLRWLPTVLPKGSSAVFPVLPVALALVTCGELILNNPTITPGGPYCPGDVVTISFTGTNLPEGDNIQVFIDDVSTYNPFSGGGSLIGSIPIDYTCSTPCPQVLAVMVNACNAVGSDEQNEFMMLSSGCGINVNNLIINPSVGGSGVNDSIGGSNGCQFQSNSILVSTIIANSTGCTGNVFAAGPGDIIPGGAIVLVFTDATGPTINYNFSDLCASGLPVYILQSTCDRVLGAFSNTSASSPGYTLTGCASGTLSYGVPPTPSNNNTNIVAVQGSFVQSSPCESPGLSGINYPDIPNAVSSLTYTIPTDICGSGSGSMNFYISGMIDINPPCQDVIYTPPSALSMSVICAPVVNPAGPFCENDPAVQLVGNPGGGTWSGPGVNSSGLFTPDNANNGINNIVYTIPTCSLSTTIQIQVFDSPTISIAGFDISAVTCEGENSGSISFNPFSGLSGGTGPFDYDWDDTSIPGNQDYDTDHSFGAPGVDSLFPGFYELLVTDANGCTASMVVYVEDGFSFNIETQVTNVTCNGGSNGGLQITNPTMGPPDGPPGFYVYDWNWVENPGNEDFGAGEMDWGLPPEEDDPQDILTGLGAGTYTVTISVSDDPLFPSYTCMWDTTLIVTQPTPVVATITPNPLVILCFGGSGSATVSGSGGTPYNPLLAPYSTPYMYNWSHIGGLNNPPTVSGLTVGTYSVTITDANGCSDVEVLTVTQPASPLTATAVGETLACNDGTGNIDLTPSGGTPVYTYLWSNSQTTQDLANLLAGTYTVTVTDANGCTTTASATITVTPPTFTMPPNGGSTVPCISNAQVVPPNPAVFNSCGTALTVTGPTVTANPACSGTKVYTWTYTDPVTGNSATWTYTYTISPPTFTLPANGTSTVACISNAQVVPTPPVVMNSCGATITPTGPVIGADPVCSGTKVYTWTYTDCTGTSLQWTHTYTVSPPTFTMPAGGSSTVACIINAQVVPTPPVINNSCGVALARTGPVVSSDPVCSGTKTYTWTYIDCTGNSAPWVYTYTISPPTVTMPAGGSSTVPCIINAQTVPTPPAVNNSCGTALSITGPTVGADPVCSGTKTYTWTYTDCTGTTYPWVFTYTVSPPTMTLPANGGSTVPCIVNAQTVPTPPSVMNSCGTTITPTGPVVGANPVCSGTKTYTWTYTNCTGASAQWVYTYTISPPTFTLPANGTATVACIVNAQTVPTPPTVMNSCGATITPTGPVVGPNPVCSGTKTYTWTYTDCTGTALQWVFTYTVSPPTFTVPAGGSSTVPCVSNAQVVPTPPTVMNSCGATITPTGPVVGADPACSGPKTYTWTYTDCTGNSLPWVYTYTIQPATFTLPANGSSTVACIINAQTVPTPPTVTNTCGQTVTPTGPVVGADPVCSGTKTYTWTYTDCTGNAFPWVYTYTVSPPTFSLPAGGGSTVPCISNAQTVPTPPVVNNSCGAPLTISGPAVGANPVCSGTKTYTFTYTDCTGNSAPWVYTYTISPPTVTAPAPGNATVACVSDAQVVPVPPVVNNSCGAPLTRTGPVVSADPVCSGTKTYTWTYTDCTGSTVQYVFTYTISPPTMTLPANGSLTVACISNAQTVPTPPAVTNSCGTTITPTGPVVGADPVCSGTKTYTWTYTNCTGSSAQWVFTYTVSPPTFSLPANGSSTVPCIVNAQTVPTPPTVMNSCGATITPTGPVVGPNPVCSGTKTYTWTYTDCTGSSLQWVFTYTVSPPTFTVPAGGSSTVPCIVNAQVVPTPPSVMNSCGATITPTGPVVSADPVCGGTKTYTWTYTDCTGSSLPWVYTYTIQPSTFTLPANGSTTVACIINAQTVPTPPTVTNTCGENVVPTGPVVGADPVCSGTKTYTWTYTDCTGNALPWVFTYTVSPPTFSLPAGGGSTVACISNAQTVPTPPTVNNSCGTPLTISGPAVGADPVCSGTKTYTFTYTDCTGNSAPWVYTYTISPPTVTPPAPGNATVACVSDAQVVPVPPVVNNSCGAPLTRTGPVVSADPVCSGTKTYTWTYTDCTGGTVQYVFTYTVNPPTSSLPAGGGSTVACISNAQVVPSPPAVDDSCGDPLSITGPVVGADPVCSGTKTYTWTYTSCTGSSAQWVYTYTVSPPTFSLPANGSSTVACISNAQTVPTPPSVTNSCGATITPTGPVVGPNPVCSGTKTYTWTYTDCTGSSLQWVFTYTISPPTFTVPPGGSSTVPCIVNAQVVPTPPAVMNSCGATITPTGPVVSADPVCGGTKTYTWTYTDCTGSSLPWVYTYTIQPSTFTLPANGGSTVACISNAQTVPTPPTVTNTCGEVVVPTGPVVGADPVCSGTKTYTWTYTDCTGNALPWVYTYTVSPPTFSLPAGGGSTVACISNAQTVPTPPVVNNSCGSPLTISGPVVGADPVCSGTKTYTFTYTDCTGNSAPWVYTYTISPPTVTPPAPGNATVACVSDAQVVPVPPVVNNSCGAPLTRTGPVVSADPVCSGTKTYTWTYTDCTGGTVQYVFTYTVNPPTSSLPAGGGSTVACISDAQTVPAPPSVDDSCGDPLSITGPVVGADPVCSGTKTYTWTYTSCTGSSAQWVYTYTVSPPTFSLPANGSSTVACISNAQTVPTPPSVTNSCGATITPTGPVIGADPVCSGTKTYTWTYTDCTGSSLQWVFTYTISPPTFSVPAGGSSTVACISDAQVVPTPPAVTNSCGTSIVPTGPVVGADPVCSGTKTYTWTYTDCTGTALQWVYTYTVSPSTFTLPANGGSTVVCISDAQVVPSPPAVTNTCGDPVVPTGPVVSADPACSGTKTYTWTYTDCSGNSLPWVYTYTINPPTFSLPAGGSSTVACISNAQVVPAPPAVNNSCGTPLIISGPVVGADPVCSGTKTFTWTYTDCTGSSAQWVYTYTVSPPTFSLPAAGGSTVACVSDAQVVPTPPTVNNSCGAPLAITGPVVSADPVCSGTKTYTWTYTDCTGINAQWVYTYTVTPPTSSLPANGSSTVPCIVNAQVVPAPPSVDNSCGDPLSVTGPVVGADPVCSGTKTYTWTYTDCTGSSAQWIYTYTVSPPTFTLPANGSSTVACIVNAQVVPTAPTVTNSCGATITPTGPVVGADPVCSGTKTYTWTYTDCTGSTLQWVFTYTVSPPTFSLPADGSSTVSCIIDAQVPPAPPTVNNSCGTPINPTGPVVSPDPVCSGIKTFTWTYTDCTGNSLDWVYTFTITPPTFTVPAGGNSTVACISDAQTVPSPPSVTNSCGDPVTPTGPVVGADPVCSGTKTYTWTYTDCSGTNTPWVYTYTISPPTFTLPANGSSTVACISDAQVVPAPPAVNNSCGAPLAITGPVIGADPVCSGPKTYTWTYTDCTGSTGQWVYTYTVTPPTVSMPAPGSSTVACISNAQVVPTPPVVNNSCGSPLSISGPVVGPDPVCSGTKTYTWTYTDCTGSTTQWVYTYTVTPPTSSLPSNGSSTVACISDAQVVPSPPVVNNSCGDPLSVSGPVVGADPVCSGTKTYTWTYTDCTGSSAQWIYTYTVSPPTFTVPAPGSATVACIIDAQTVPAPPVVNNSCGDPVTPTGPVVGADPVCSGTKTYTWTYTDCTGSSLPWVFTYTISPPTFTLPADGGTTVPCIIDAQTPPAPPAVNNSCGDPIVPTGPVASADPVCSGTKTYTWTYTDCTGGSDTWVYTFTINAPTFTVPAPGSSTVACISDAQVVPTPPVVNNSCGDPVTPTGPVVSADPVCSGTKTYTWTYTDCSGTNTPWVYTYTISPPTFTLPANGSSTVACISDAQVVPAPPAVNNSCGTPLTISGPVVGANPVCSGTKTYTWTYTDCTGSAGQWVYTYTVSPPTFSLPAGGSSTVACVSDAQVVPAPPVVNNSCGAPLAITGPVVGPDPVCSGTKTYTWTYTDCTGTTGQWVYTYTVTPPTSSIPGNAGSTVACISNAQVVPAPPGVNNSCGDPLSVTGPVVGADPVCSGTKTYTWTFTDCTGSSGDWVYTYTITPPTFTVPAPGSSTVACIDDAQTVPTPPAVNNSCGDPVIPTGPVVGADPVCSGTKTYTWTYTDCTGNSLPWVFTYTITPPTFTLPADGGSTVPCIIDAQVPPAPPVVNNSCGDPIVPTGPVAGADPVCSGTKTFTWTYTDCTGSSADWVYTFTIPAPTFTVPANGGSTVACIVDAQTVPSPPTVNNSCGDPVTPTGPVVGADPVCSGTKTYTWTYTDCSGTNTPWVYTYTISPPTFTLPANGSSTVACIIDAQTVPVPPAVNNSCGTPLSISGPVVGADPVCSGPKTYTWTYTDCTGTTGQWVYTYTITPPTFTLPANDGSTVNCVSDAQIVPVPPAVNNSCGTPLSITGPVVGPDPVCSGTKTYTWTYTDCTGTTGQWVYTYTVSPPSSSVPADGGSIVACISDAQVVPTPPVVNNSCGDPLSVTGPVEGADPVCSGTKTYTWTYTDCTGATDDWVFTYTISPPTFTLPAGGTSTVACISDAQTVPVPPSVSNSCGAPIVPSGPVEGADPVCSGTKTYTWTYTDCTGSSQDWVYTYTISPPTFTLPSDDGSTVSCVADAQIVPAPPVVSNSCGDPVSASGPVVSPDPTCAGTKTYTWTYTDCTGNSLSWVYTYTVMPSLFTLPANGTSTVACIVDAQTVPAPPTVTNSCGDPVIPTGPVVGADPVCSGTKVYTWTFTDCNGNSLPWTFTYTISAPTFTLPADDGSTVPCIGDAQTVPVPPVVNNSCGDPVAVTGPVVSADPACSGPKTYTWTYTDCTGNSADWVYTYTVTPPSFSLPADDGSTVACVSDAQVVPTPPAADNACGDPLTISGPVVSADPVCSGTKTYTWTYTECTGATGDWVYTYTISPPSVTMPVDGGSTVACVSDAQVVPTPPVVNNSCGDPLSVSGPVVSADPVCSGTKTYTWTYTDCTGSNVDWVYTYTIPPTNFVLPPDQDSTVACALESHDEPTPPEVFDGCGELVVPTLEFVGADPGCFGGKPYQWEYLDCNGNALIWTFTYNISPPTYSIPPDAGSTVECISDAQVMPGNPTIITNCGFPIFGTGPVIGPDPISCSGPKTYTWTYTDCVGNTFDWVYTYTIMPTTFTLPADEGSSVACVLDAQVVPIPPDVTNSCGDPLVATGPVVSADPLCTGTKTYTWTYTDCAGNAADWVYTYTITSDVGPVFDAPPADISVTCVGDVPAMIDLNYTDDCSPDGSVTGTDSPLSGDCPGTITRTWTFTDECGNTGSVSQIITVNDQTPPTASDPAPIAVAGCNSPVPAPDTLAVIDEADNCSTPVVAFLSDATSLVGCTETTTRTFSVTDACGNSITVTQLITRTVDTTPPVISAPPADITVSCESEIPAIVDLTYTDNCSAGGTIVGVVTGPSGDPLTEVHTWTVTDDCGNVATVSQTITVNDIPNETNLVDDFCEGDIYTLPDGNPTSVGGIFGPYVFPGSNGCDSTVTLDLTMILPVTNDITDQFCDGDMYILPDGSTTTSGGTYGPYTFVAESGCDSIVNLELIELPIIEVDLTDEFCNGSDYTLPDGSIVTMGGSYGPFPFTGSNGCDSLVNLELTGVDPETVDLSDSFCTGDVYVLPDGSTTTVGGSYGPYIFTAISGCDSTVNLDLTGIDPVITNITDEFCSGDIYTLPNGSTTTTGGLFGPFPFTGSNGCDSLVNVDLTLLQPSTGTETYQGCEGDGYTVVVNGTTYSEALPNGVETLPGSNGCDSVITIDLNFDAPGFGTETYSGCVDDGYFVIVNGTTYDEDTPDGVENFTGPNGCDTTVTIDLNFSPGFTGIETYSGCEGDGYFVIVNGTIYDEDNPTGEEIFNLSGCDSTVTIDLLFAPVEVVNINDPGTQCTTGDPFTLTATPPGGVWSGAVSSSQFDPSALGVGVHQVVYTVNPGACASADTIDVLVYEITIACETIKDETMPGDDDGAGQVTISGGNAPYDVTWSPGSGSIIINADGSFTINDLSAGTYTVEVIDATGCTTSCQFVINVGGPCEIIIDDIVIQDATCSGIDDGAISVNVSGGVIPYEYSIDGIDFQTSNIFPDLAPGTYTIYVTDATGCFVTENVTIGVGPGPELEIVLIVDATCGVLNGSIEVSATGGSTPYTYSIDGTNYGASGFFGGLGAGSYVIYLIDAAGCTDTLPAVVAASNAPVITGYDITNSSCGNADGSIEVFASGGVPPLEYSINGVDFQSSPIFMDLAAGTYTITVRDATGCSVTGTATISDIGAPVIDAVNIVEPDCGQTNGTITIIATGTPTLSYSINGTTYVSSNVFGPLAPGPYTVYVRDGNGCITSQPVTVNTADGPQIDNIIVVDTECGQENGSITIIASGGTGDLEYSIGDGFDDENEFPDLEEGTYNIIVRDEDGCEATAQVTIEDSDGPDLDVIVEPAHCGMANGYVILDGSGGVPPYTYSFNGSPFGPVSEFGNLLSDFYPAAVRDAAGCIFETEVFVFEQGPPQAPNVETTDPECGLNDGTIEVTNPDDDLQYTISHPNFYQDSPIFYPVAPGTYTVTAKDEWGCTSTAVVVINATPSPVITNVIVVNSTCGASTGSLTVIVTGGTMPYMYSLDGVNFVSSNIFTGLPAGPYTVFVKGANGCEDSEDRVITSVGAQLASVTEELCPGDTLIVAGDTFTTTGIHTINLIGEATNGCDSIITLTINPLDLEELTITETICEGEVYTINGVDYSSPGVYLVDTIDGSIGCDTIRTLDLSVDPLETTYIDVTICNQGVYTINGVDYTVAGTYTIDTISAAIGCDSIRILRLEVDDYNESTIVAEICEGDVYTINGVDYTTTGIFLIDTVPGPNGCDTIRSLDLTVNPIPFADAGADQILDCSSPSAVLNGTATNGSPLWTGPGINAGNETQLNPEVTQPGTYYLTVTSGSNCVDSDSVVVTIDPQTVIAYAGVDDSLSCDIDTVVLQANPIGPNYTYQWTGPGINGTNENLVNPIVTVEGIYSLVVTDNLTGCISAPDQVLIEDITRDIIAIIQDPTNLNCFSTFVNLDATGSSVGQDIIYIWFNAQGDVIANSPFVDVSSAGTFMFVVKDTLSGCFDEDTVSVEDLSLYPPVDAGDPQQIDCNNNIVTLNEGATNNLENLIFDWEGPPGGILTPDHLLSVDVGTAGFYYLYATDTVSMCTNYDSVLVTSATAPPLADIAVLEEFTCLDETAMLDIGLSDTGSDITYEWNGPQINGVNATMIEPIQPGTFILTVANSTTGCIAFDTVLLELPDLPSDVDIDIEIPLCQGDASGTLTINSVVGGIPVYTYSLNGDTAQFIPFFEGLAAGNYVLTVVDANGCEYQESFTMPDGVLLTIDIGPNIDIVLGDSIQLSADVSLPWNLIDSIVWASGDHLSCTHCIDPTLYGLLDEILTATVYAGGCVAEDQLAVRVDVDADVYIPNVFSPNGDDINEWVTVFASDNVRKVVYLEIFDRWGNLVFRNTDFLPNIESLGWDGTFKNKPMNPAVFAFIAKVELINGQHLPFKGDITLLR